MHRYCPNFAIYILVDPVSLTLLAKGTKFWVLYSFCEENFGFLPHFSVSFPPEVLTAVASRFGIASSRIQTPLNFLTPLFSQLPPEF